MRIVRMLAEVSIYSAVILLAILMFRRVFRKSLSPALRYALWFVLLARLVLPVTIDGGVRLFPQSVADGLQGVPARITAAEEALDAVPAQAAAGEAQTNAGETAQAADVPSGAAKRSPGQMLALAWLGGAALCGGWMLVSYFALCGRIRRHAAPPSERLSALFEYVKSELPVRGNVRLLCLYEYGAPALAFPNVLLMPVNALVAMDDDQVSDALRHELTHFKRGDHLVSALLSALCAAYWFNPMVWIASRLMRDDMETACDARVMRGRSAEQRRGYAALILALYAQPPHRALALCMAGHGARRQAERRVRGVFLRQRSGLSGKLAAAALTLMLAFGCFTTACQPVVNTSGHAKSAENPWPSDVPERKIARVERKAEEIADGVTLAVRADVTEPVHGKNSIIRVEQAVFDVGEFSSILAALAPELGAVEITGTSGVGVLDPEKLEPLVVRGDMTSLYAAFERGDTTYELYAGVYPGDGVSYFSYGAKDIYVIRESYFVNDPEIEYDYGEAVREPIEMTAAEARPQAEAVLEALGASGLMLQSAERACWFDTGEDGAQMVLSRGWDFIYVPNNNGLPVYYRGGRSGNSRIYGERFYAEPIREMLSVYVDDTGVARIYWPGMCVQTEVLEDDVELLPYGTILEKAKARLAERYMKAYEQGGSKLELVVTKIQLAAAIVSDEAMSEAEAFQSGGITGRLVPVWEVICTVGVAGEEPYETFVLPYCAVDGVPLLEQN